MRGVGGRAPATQKAKDEADLRRRTCPRSKVGGMTLPRSAPRRRAQSPILWWLQLGSRRLCSSPHVEQSFGFYRLTQSPLALSDLPLDARLCIQLPWRGEVECRRLIVADQSCMY